MSSPAPGRVATGAQQATASKGQSAPPATGTPHYDVVLEVPELTVGDLELNLAGALAKVSVEANAAHLVAISAGVLATIDRLKLGLYGVEAELFLYADLDNVGHIVRRVVRTLDHNPQILVRLLATTDSLVRTVGDVAHTAVEPGGVVSEAVGTLGTTMVEVTEPDGLLSQSVNQLGQTVQQIVTRTGTLVERTVDASGRLVNERTIASVRDLPVVQEVGNPVGQTLRTVRTSGGDLIDVTLDQAGNIVDAAPQKRMRGDGGGGGGDGVTSAAQPLQNVRPMTEVLSQFTDTRGRTVQQVVTEKGTIVEQTVDAAGKVLNERTVASALSLPVVREAASALGNTVRTVRAPSGNLIDVTLDQAGNVVGATAQQAGAAAGAAGTPAGRPAGAAGDAGQVTGLLSTVTDRLGLRVQRVVTSTGALVERTLDPAGKVLDSRRIGSILDLPLVRQGRNAAGQATRVVRDSVGNRIEATLDSAGKVVRAIVLQPNGTGDAAARAASGAVENVGAVTGLLSQVNDTLGRRVQRVVTQTGSILERTLDSSGRVLDSRTVGSVLDLPLVRDGTNAEGQPIRVVRDTAGNLIEATLAPTGNVIGCRVIQRR